MITYETDELKKCNRKNINATQKKGRTAETYSMNIERKILLKQRRERTLQNAKGQILVEEYFLTALKASHKSYKASKNLHKRKKDNNGSINDENTNIIMTVHDINNLEIVENHEVNATTNVQNADTESADIDNINTAETEIDKNDDIEMSDNDDDNLVMSDKESSLESPANDNIIIHTKTKIKIRVKINMPQAHQIPMNLIIMTHEYMNSTLKENQKIKI